MDINFLNFLIDDFLDTYVEFREHKNKFHFVHLADVKDKDIVDFKNIVLEQTSNNKKIIILGQYEAFEQHVCKKLHEVLDEIPDVNNKIFFITGSDDVKASYETFIKNFRFKTNVIFISYNFWEKYTIKKHTNKSLLEDNKFDVKTKEKKFLSLNRRENTHRLYLCAHAIKHGWIDESFYSYVGATEDFLNNQLRGYKKYKQYLKEHNKSSKIFQQWIIDVIENNKHLFPILIDDIDTENLLNINETMLNLHNQSYLSIVTETYFFKDKQDYKGMFLTEKTFKPILSKHPFILVSHNGSLDNLRNLGYKTFHPHIDETYDETEDNEERILRITDEILRLRKQDDNQWIQFQYNIQDIVEHNYYHMLNSRKNFKNNTVDKMWFD